MSAAGLLTALQYCAPATASGGAAAPASRAPVTIIVRVYEQSTRTAGLAEALQSSAARLLKDAPVHVRFVDCTDTAGCMETPIGDSFVLRIAPGLHPTHPRQCGTASATSDGRRGVLMTVFRACASETRRGMRLVATEQRGLAVALLTLTEADLLAVFIVHELIHLVLPDEAHGRGLFKAPLDTRDWWEVASGHPQIDARIMTRLQHALASPAPQPVSIAGGAAATAPAASTPASASTSTPASTSTFTATSASAATTAIFTAHPRH